MRIVVVTLFPELVTQALAFGVLGRALARDVLTVETIDPRQFAIDLHRTVDDRPYGGGPGMVMKARVAALARLPGLVLVAGRYEGVDERFVECCIDETVSVGDLVLSGGELPALMLIDAMARLLPGTLGCAESAEHESFTTGLLDWPHYTRPEVWEGRPVPPVLLGGNHAEIERWRRRQALGRTRARRPDLLDARELTREERRLLEEYAAEQDATRLEAGKQ